MLQRIDKLPVHLRWLVRALLLAAAGFVFYMWCGSQQPALTAALSQTVECCITLAAAQWVLMLRP